MISNRTQSKDHRDDHRVFSRASLDGPERSTILHRHMSDIHLLARARQSFEQRAWADAYRLFAAADREAPLDPEDLERLATAAYLMGRDDESEAFWDAGASGVPRPRRPRRRRAIRLLARVWTAACAAP